MAVVLHASARMSRSGMRVVVFGLTVSSSWGNGHATIWRGLIRALARRGHHVTFFERDVPYYASHRDLPALPDGELILYERWADIDTRARDEARSADVALVTSYCPDAVEAADLVRVDARCSGFYDLDTAVTLARLERGEEVEYVPTGGLRGFDLVLSYTGGRALTLLRERLGASRVSALYGSVDPDAYPPAPRTNESAALSYLGTYAADRADAFERLLIQPARTRPDLAFLIGGSQYPASRAWPANVRHADHVRPADHPSFYACARFTLNLTRGDMAALGYCPSGRLFEAAACETPILTDTWPGLDHFFAPGVELLPVHSCDSVLAALDMPDEQRREMAAAARRRVLACHTAEARAAELEAILRGLDTGADEAAS